MTVNTVITVPIVTGAKVVMTVVTVEHVLCAMNVTIVAIAETVTRVEIVTRKTICFKIMVRTRKYLPPNER